MVTAVRNLALDRARLVAFDGGWACPAATPGGAVLVVGGTDQALPVAERVEIDGETVAVMERSRAAARALRRLVPWLRPRPLGAAWSFGFGDRLGRATPGHARALVATGSGFQPVFAQQSARELERLGRTFDDVLDCATWGVLDAGWRSGYGADADHLRTVEEVRAAVAGGFTMFTLDPSARVDPSVDGASRRDLEERVAALPWAELQDDWRSLRRRFAAAGDVEVATAAARYGCALAHVATLAAELPQEVDVEVSIDETPRPTTPFEHAFVARELRRLGVRATSIAPRFPGRWPKGTDVSGEGTLIAIGIAQHAAVAAGEGHKLSVHSGSDKLSAYPALAGGGCALHVKTSGTSYLEALRVVAAADGDLFRHILAIARSTFAEQRHSYTLDEDAAVPVPAAVADEELPALLDARGSRQALHVTFGAVLQDPLVRARLDACLERHADTYAAALERHLGRHLELLAPAA